jgi:hypothetical protein
MDRDCLRDLASAPSRSPQTRRNRPAYLLALGLVIGLGLLSRRFGLPSLLGKYPGDALWALMVFLGWGILFPNAPTARVGACALGVCLGIEVLKFYHAPWIEALRNAPGGRLVFGYAFSWANLVAYCVGTGLGLAAEKRAGRRRPQ